MRRKWRLIASPSPVPPYLDRVDASARSPVVVAVGRARPLGYTRNPHTPVCRPHDGQRSRLQPTWWRPPGPTLHPGQQWSRLAPSNGKKRTLGSTWPLANLTSAMVQLVATRFSRPQARHVAAMAARDVAGIRTA